MRSIFKIVLALFLFTFHFSSFSQKVYLNKAALYKDSLLYFMIGATSVMRDVPATILKYYPEHNGVFKVQIVKVDSMAFCKNRLLELPHYNINVSKNEKIEKIDTLICFVSWSDIAAPVETLKSILKFKNNTDSLYQKGLIDRRDSLHKAYIERERIKNIENAKRDSILKAKEYQRTHPKRIGFKFN